MAIMSQRKGLEFESDILSDTTNLNFLTEKLINRFGDDIHLFRDATRGGVASVLSEIASDIQIIISIRGLKIISQRSIINKRGNPVRGTTEMK